MFSEGDTSLTLNWSPVLGRTRYEVVAFPISTTESTFNKPSASITDLRVAEGVADVLVASPSAATLTTEISLVSTALKAKSPAIRTLVRACNICGCSNWDSLDVKLLSQILVQYYELGTTNSCGNPVQAGSLAPTFTSPVNTTLSFSSPGGLFAPITPSLKPVMSAAQSFTNIWFAPTPQWFGVPGKYSVTAPVSDLSNNNYSLACSSTITGLDAPSEAVFYLNKAFDAWWRTVGGLIGANGGDIESKIPITCKSDSSCIDSLAGAAVNPVIPKNDKSLSAGIPMAGKDHSLSIGSGGGRRTQNLSTANNEQFAENSSNLNLAPTTGYYYFDSLVTKEEGFNNIISSSTFNPTSGTRMDGAGTPYVWRKDGDMNIVLSSARWNIGSNKVIILVKGNINFTGDGVTPFINMGTDGFLLVIASGDITFENSVGKEVLDPSTLKNNINNPSVTGIFISDKTLIIEGVGGDALKDKQFLGKGVFAGLENVKLGRWFDSNAGEREYNNLIPGEIFIHDPQMVLNTPKFLREPMMSYQEVL